MSTTQYQIVVNDTRGPVSSQYLGAHWSAIADDCEQRGLLAQFLRRNVFDADIIPCIAEEDGSLPDGWWRLRDQVVTAWQVIAEFDYRGRQQP